MCRDRAYYNPAFRQMPHFGVGFRRPKYNVPVNISETETAYEVQVFATGFSKEQIKLAVKEDVLIITGEKEIENAPKFTQQEFPVKTFERAVALNRKVDVELITARHEAGMLLLPYQNQQKLSERMSTLK